MIRNFSEFCAELLKTGFSVASGSNDEGVVSLLTPRFSDHAALAWHTNDPDTDPWEWRVRVLDERDDIAYGKMFFRKAGYITREWYPTFLAARRDGQSFEDAYADGLYSQNAKRIFETLSENGPLPMHEIKSRGGFHREDASRFEKALTDLQMGLFITMCGQRQKISKTGEGYGWASMMYCTVEQFWPQPVFDRAASVSPKEAEAAIAERVNLLNPNADQKNLRRFIYGR